MDIIRRLLLLLLCGCVGSEPLGRLLQRRRDAFELYAREFSRAYEPYMYAAVPLHAPVPVLRVLSRAPPAPLHAQQTRLYPQVQYADPARQYAEPARHYAEPTRHYAEPARHYAEPARHFAESTRHYAEPARPYSESTRSYAKPARPYAASEPDYDASSYDYSRDYARAPSFQKPRRQVPPAYDYAAEYDSYLPQLPAIQSSQLPRLTYAIAPYESVAYSATQEAAPTVLYARPSPSGGFTYRRVPDATAAPKKKAPAPLKEKEKDPPFILKIHKYRIVKDDLI